MREKEIQQLRDEESKDEILINTPSKMPKRIKKHCIDMENKLGTEKTTNELLK